MSGNQLVWELVVLSVVYLVDLVVFVALCRDEVRAWRKGRRNRSQAAAGYEGGALRAR